MLGDVRVLRGHLGSKSQVVIQEGIWVPGGIWVTDGGLGGVWIMEFHVPECVLVLIGGFGSWLGVWNSGGVGGLGADPGLEWGSGNWAVVEVGLQVGFRMLGMDLGPGQGSMSWGRV